MAKMGEGQAQRIFTGLGFGPSQTTGPMRSVYSLPLYFELAERSEVGDRATGERRNASITTMEGDYLSLHVPICHERFAGHDKNG